MRALLLAAGFGTRLRPLTNYLPKCLVPIHGRPLLDYWLETLLEHGVTEVLINTHYFAQMVADFLRRSSWARDVTVVNEQTLLGTGGTILANREFFGNAPFIVAHADNLTTFEVADLRVQHSSRSTDSELTMMVFETPDPRSCGIVGLDDRGVVTSFHEKVTAPPGNIANAAVYVLEPYVVDLMATLGKCEIDFSTEVIPKLMGRIQTYENRSYHRDIGTISSWKEAHADFVARPASMTNARAWQQVLKSVDPELTSTLEKILSDGRG